MGGAHDCENLGFCLPACLPACSLLEIRWQKGRQADQMCTYCLPTLLGAPSNFLSLTQAILLKKFHTWAEPILVASP